jgi:AcrR family transcriptional regulator
MVRVRDEEKARDRAQAILEAATDLFAEQGAWSTPTSAISKAAGIAEGTLFTYFKTKDALINALYTSLKAEFARELGAELSALENGSPATLRGALRLLWEGYLDWALAHPGKHAVMGQLRASPAITQDSREEASRGFAGLEARIHEAMEARVLRAQPFEFLAATFSGLAEATLAYIAERPRERAAACDQGFQTLWDGIAFHEPLQDSGTVFNGDIP